MQSLRVFCTSDVHIDYAPNMEWVRSLSSSDYKHDALIVAGDVTHRLALLEEFFALLTSKFQHVFYVPGNHDLWLTDDRHDPAIQHSLDKFDKIVQLCRKHGVLTEPTKIGAANPIWIVPLFSWYHRSFDAVPLADDEQKRILAGWNDYRFCKWLPEHLNQGDESPLNTPEQYFLNLNLTRVNRTYDAPVISFSHFLPRPECLPPRERLFIPYLPKVVGSLKLDEQIRSINSIRHVFGHTHINWNALIDGVHYIQLALKYPKERESSRTPTDMEQLLIFSESEAMQDQYLTMKQRFQAHNLAVYELPGLQNK
jgi:Icc-related predicted phosphoesterase